MGKLNEIGMLSIVNQLTLLTWPINFLTTKFHISKRERSFCLALGGSNAFQNVDITYEYLIITYSTTST